MRVCILGSNLTALTLAKALVNQNISVDIISSIKKYKIDKSRTIGISKSNYDYFNKYIINIEKISWKLKKIEIYTDNLKNEKLLNFENNNVPVANKHIPKISAIRLIVKLNNKLAVFLIFI